MAQFCAFFCTLKSPVAIATGRIKQVNTDKFFSVLCSHLGDYLVIIGLKKNIWFYKNVNSHIFGNVCTNHREHP